MTKQAAAAVAKVLRRAAAHAALSDRDLLKRYAEAGDQTAFAAVVNRHWAMVLGVCRRVLHSQADAEDACQAVFLILSKKVKSVSWQASVANWLYATARKVAHNARVSSSRRTKRERAAAVPESVAPADRMTGRELVAVLDEELDRLPPRYREPLVLCYLEGLTRDEAAARLGVQDGTLKKQLERGRKLLADALTARGCALGVVLLATAATSSAGACPPRLLDSILAAANGSPSASAAALAQGVAVNGAFTKAKLAVLAAVGAAVMGLGFASLPIAAEPQKPAVEKRENPPTKAEAKGDSPKSEGKERTITGRVLAADGKPVAAELILLRIEGEPESLGKTAADGTFKVTVPLKEPGAYLIAKADGHGIDFTMPAASTPAEVTFRLSGDNPVRGRVIDTQGKPIAGAVVSPHRVDDYGARGADLFLNHWKTKDPQSGPLHGQFDIRLTSRTGFNLPDGRMVLAAKTDADGQFELRGLGAERVVSLFARGPGVADAEVLVVNRADFDPTAVNRAAADNRERMLPKGLRPGLALRQLHGPTVTVVAEREKVIRGVVKDRDTGKPRANVEVTFGRVSNMELLPHVHTATTGKDGRFEIRGGRKHSAYIPEVAADPDTGYLPSQVEVKDTAGYEPIEVEILTVKGVILTGRLTDKETGKPLAGIVSAEPMRENPFLKKYPAMDRSRSGTQQCVTREDGSFRMAIPPGPVLVMAGLRVAQHEVMYKPPQVDPQYPQYFHTKWGTLAYFTSNGGETPIRGCWCKVVDAGEGAKTVTQHVELEPAKRKAVRVVDQDGKPVPTCDAAGVAPKDMYPIGQDSGTVYVYGLEPKKERLIVVCQQVRRLVGSAVVRDADRDPVVTLGPGGTAKGRLVGADGKPLAGVTVHLRHLSSEADRVFALLHFARQVVTDANGEFTIDTAIPGHEFRLAFSKGTKTLGAKPDQAPRHTIDKHGDTLKLGDVKLSPPDTGGEE